MYGPRYIVWLSAAKQDYTDFSVLTSGYFQLAGGIIGNMACPHHWCDKVAISLKLRLLFFQAITVQ